MDETSESIARDSLKKILEPFWRPAESNPNGGLGLGLRICSRLAKAQGGPSQISSSAENVTCFTTRLPALRGSTASACAA